MTAIRRAVPDEILENHQSDNDEQVLLMIERNIEILKREARLGVTPNKASIQELEEQHRKLVAARKR